MSLTAARQVADAVLYEGYLLYPYRASSSKNVVRWQFGVLGPRGAAEAGVGEESAQSCEVLLEPTGAATIDLHLRFLQVQARVVEQLLDGQWSPVEALLVAGTRWIAFHEAVPCEIDLTALSLGTTHELDVTVAGAQEIEELREDGLLVGRLVRRRWPLAATVTVTPRAGQDLRLVVLGIGVRNATAWTARDEPGWTARDVAARCALVGTHLLATSSGARFVSLLEGPGWSDADARSCVQQRCWPLLVHDDDGADALLVAPIILGDHPSIAPESAGDLFDATEIDEILTLRVLTMTEQEKAEARGTDPRAAAILARCDALTDEGLQQLHGAQRPTGEANRADDPVAGLGEVPAVEDEVPWWDADQDARAEPERDLVMVDGVPVAKGRRVRLRPSRRADAQDMFLAEMEAVVARVYFDVDGDTHVAVMLADDPGKDLYAATGRFYFFGPEEIEPLPDREAAR